MSQPGLYTTLALLADAFCLGTHWVYDQDELAALLAQKDLELRDPLSSYHPHRRAGQWTHYGDQIITLWQFLNKHQGWDRELFLPAYLQSWEQYDGYLDGATRTTRAWLTQPTQPRSAAADLAGVTRIAPFFDQQERLSGQALRQAISEYISLTHHDSLTIAVGTYLVAVTEKLHEQSEPLDLAAALHAAAPEMSEHRSYFEQTLAQARAAAQSTLSTAQFAQQVGLACQTKQGFPLVLFICLRAEGDLTSALIENNLAGGENAARAGLLAMLLAPFTRHTDPLFDHWSALDTAKLEMS